jgi:hypothetical protein
MTKHEQMVFIRELSDNVVAELATDILTGKVPEEWGGIELRALLAERFRRAVFSGVFSRRRKIAFNKEMINRNL